MSSHGVNICVKFHENMPSGFKVMERTQKLLTDTNTPRRLMVFNVCVKFQEKMLSGFKLMSRHVNC